MQRDNASKKKQGRCAGQFYVNLIKARVISEEGLSNEKRFSIEPSTIHALSCMSSKKFSAI